MIHKEGTVMAFLGSFDISASGMSAQRVRMDIAAEDIANMDTTRTESGGPYRRKNVLLESYSDTSFAQAMENAARGKGITSRHAGVRVSGIVEDDREAKKVYNPDHPDADADGYVTMPNVDVLKETVDSMSATRSYEANVTALNAIKLMAQKALEIGLKPIVVVNKVDKPNCRPEEVYEMVFDLMFSLNATEDQLDFPVIYGSAKNNWMSTDWQKPTETITPLLDCIIENIPAPKQLEGTPQMLITSLDYSSYTGRIAVGRVHRGTLKEGMNITLVKRNGDMFKSKIKELHVFEGLGRVKTNEVSSGDICALVGIEGFEIGDTVCDFENPEALPPIAIDEPTMSMLFAINDSPFFGKDGKFVTSRHIHDRLMKELDKNLALRVRKSEEDGKWIVSGRGVLHLSVLIETMRREGYELQVGQPQVIFKEIDGVKCEPIEELTINVPEEYSSKIIDMVTRRKGEMVKMENTGERINLEFDMPSRGIIGLRTNVLTASAGEAIMAHRFKEYQPHKGEIERRTNGSMIAMETGTAFAYAIDKLQDRGKFFIFPQEDVYAGQVVGEHSHDNDLVINVTKSKKLTNMRASGSDDKVRLIPPVQFSLEEALEYIKEDEYVEVTPKAMRMRKVILDEIERKRANKN